jgi:type IV secretion system protein VirB10
VSTPEREGLAVPGAVAGERGTTLANAARSVQSRVSSAVAASLMMALGLSALGWYYAHALNRGSHALKAAQTAASVRAQGEMPLPSLGRISPPPATALAPSPTLPQALPPDPVPSTAALAPDLPLIETHGHPWNPGVAGTAGSGAMEARVKTQGEIVLERRLSGLVLARDAQPPAAAQMSGQVSASPDAAGAQRTDGGAPTATGASGTLAALLRPDVAGSEQAQLLPPGRFLLPKGAFIDCTLETAIDSTLPGLTTCITAADTFSADGTVVLLERGTKLVGETRGQVRQGQARVFVVWTQARTPAGVLVPLDSPGTDELGRAGLPGEVQRHFWQRFGAAMLISLVEGAVQAGVQSANHSGGAVIYTPSASTDVLTEVLKDSLQIAPTIAKRNGERIQVLVAHDVDFRSVYELRTTATGR